MLTVGPLQSDGLVGIEGSREHRSSLGALLFSSAVHGEELIELASDGTAR